MKPIGYFHLNDTDKILYDEILPNDLVFESGCLFHVSAVWGAKHNEDNRVVIRTEDRMVEWYVGNIQGQGIRYVGWLTNVVGAGAWVYATIVKREIAHKLLKQFGQYIP